MSDVFTIAEVAERLKCSQSTVYSLVDRGELAAINLGSSSRRTLRFTQESLAAYLQTKPVAAKSLPSREVADIRIARFMRGAS
jgi:excisionase family DNA binding protein